MKALDALKEKVDKKTEELKLAVAEYMRRDYIRDMTSDRKKAMAKKASAQGVEGDDEMIEYQRMKHASGERKRAAGGSRADHPTPGSNMRVPSGHPGDRREAPSGFKNKDPSGRARGTDRKNEEWTDDKGSSGSPIARRGNRRGERDSAGGDDLALSEENNDNSPKIRATRWPATETPSDAEMGSDGSPAVRLREMRPSEREEPNRLSYAAIMAADAPKRASRKPSRFGLSPLHSDRTEGLPGRGDNDTTDTTEMRPIVAPFGKNIVVNRGHSQAQQDLSDTKEMMVQTDTEIFFKYIFDFMGELEKRISSGEITLEDIMAMGRMSY